MKTTFIYALCEPGTRTIRYIGMTGNPKQRLKGHWCRSRKYKSHLGSWLRSLDKKPDLVVLREVPRQEWKAAEERYIRLAKGIGMRLVNGTDGGDGGEAYNKGEKHPQFGRVGPASHNFGRKHTEEARANMSRAHLGHIQTEETKAKRKGENHPQYGKTGPDSLNYGRKPSAETLARRSVSLKAAWAKRKAKV